MAATIPGHPMLDHETRRAFLRAAAAAGAGWAAAGGILARELATAGFSVVVIERGATAAAS